MLQVLHCINLRVADWICGGPLFTFMKLKFNCSYCGRPIAEDAGALLFGPPLATHDPLVTLTEKRHICIHCWPQVRDGRHIKQVIHRQKLPAPTPEQAACLHAKWGRLEYQPRHCVECGLMMWDAGD